MDTRVSLVCEAILQARRGRSICMTKILDQAIAKARALSDQDQDAIGAVLLSLAEE